MGDPVAIVEDRKDVFFLIDKGSMGVATTELDGLTALGVDSVFPLG